MWTGQPRNLNDQEHPRQPTWKNQIWVTSGLSCIQTDANHRFWGNWNDTISPSCDALFLPQATKFSELSLAFFWPIFCSHWLLFCAIRSKKKQRRIFADCVCFSHEQFWGVAEPSGLSTLLDSQRMVHTVHSWFLLVSEKVPWSPHKESQPGQSRNTRKDPEGLSVRCQCCSERGQSCSGLLQKRIQNK